MITGEAAKIRILLVEDNPGDVYLLEKALCARRIGYELIRYEDGEAAVSGLGETSGPVPDLILLDLNLPKREGFEVLQAIRSRPRLVGVPVGVFTSSDDGKDRHRVALLGAERYIHKPGTLHAFIDEVGRAIEEMLAGARERQVEHH